jgi:hypothetical protein
MSANKVLQTEMIGPRPGGLYGAIKAAPFQNFEHVGLAGQPACVSGGWNPA